MGSRVPSVVVLVAVSAIGHADPGQPFSIHGKGIMPHELGRMISQEAGCNVMGMGGGNLDIDVDKRYLWDVFAKLEVDHKLHARAMGPSFMLEPLGRTKEPSWATDWQRQGPWAVAYLPGPGDGFSPMSPGDPPADTSRSRLWLVGLVEYSVDHVIIDHATANKKSIAVTTSIAQPTFRACERTVIDLLVQPPASAKAMSLQGRVVVKIPNTIERRLEVPFGDDIADFAMGRLRLHVGSAPATAGKRNIHVSWDWMGVGHTLRVDIVDEHDVPTVSSGGGSSSGGSGGSEDRTIAWTSGKRFAIIRLAGSTSTTQEIPFRFDDVAIEPTP